MRMVAELRTLDYSRALIPIYSLTIITDYNGDTVYFDKNGYELFRQTNFIKGTFNPYAWAIDRFGVKDVSGLSEFQKSYYHIGWIGLTLELTDQSFIGAYEQNLAMEAQAMEMIAPMSMMMSMESEPEYEINIASQTNGAVEVCVEWLGSLDSDSLDLFLATDLVAANWQLETNFPTAGSTSFCFIDQDTNQINRFFVFGTDYDEDLDGLTSARERHLYKTREDLSDSDGDGLGDGFEVQNDFNPLSLPGQSEVDEDADGDGLPDPLENLFFTNLSQNATNDFDGDGLLNGEELVVLTYQPIVIESDWVDMPTNAGRIDWSEYYDDYDEDYAELPIGFPFPFYGGSHTSVTVGVNGILSFGGEFGDFDEIDELPITIGTALVAPFWTDLEEWNGGVYYHTTGMAPDRRFIVSWEDMSFYDEYDSSFYFQAELRESGEILFRYGLMDSDGVEGFPTVVGVQGLNGQSWGQWIYTTNTPVSLTNGLALLFSPSAQIQLNSYPHLKDSDNDVMDDLFETQKAYLDPMNPLDGGQDFDSDGLLNSNEYLIGTLLENTDSDGDLLGDYDEFLHMNDVPDPLNPTNAVISDMLADSDDDGMTNGYELGFSFLDPFDASDGGYDSDMDGMPDELELLYFTNLNQTAIDDFDGDGLLNGQEISTSEIYYPLPEIISSEWVADSNFTHVIDWEDATVITNGTDDPYDEGFYPVDIGFEFPFYDSAYTNLFIGVNGCLSFDQAYGFNGEFNSASGIPTGDPASMIAAFWNDLSIGSGDVRYQALGESPNRSFLISWNDITESIFGAYSFRFQIELGEDGSIVFRYGYLNVDTDFLFYTHIGMQDDSSVVGVQYDLWEELGNLTTNGMALHFAPSTYVYNSDPGKWDTDGDGMDDGYESSQSLLDPLDSSDGSLDYDNDGLLNIEEYGIGTAIGHEDTDGDKLGDYNEYLHRNDFPDPLDPVNALESDMLADSDNDGMTNGFELAFSFLDPFDATDASGDHDHDGLDNLAEFAYQTDLYNWDSDGDLLPDGWEVLGSLNPLDSFGENGAEGDPDVDGLANLQEMINGTSPSNLDSDGDGAGDGMEVSQASNPNDPSDGGQAPLADEIVEVSFIDPAHKYCDFFQMV